MATPVQISVASVADDGSLTPLATAQVALVRRQDLGSSEWPHDGLGATHTEAGGHYVASSPAAEPSEGQWLLVVRATGKATVVQRLTFVTKDEVTRALAGWKAQGSADETAATVTLHDYVEAKRDPDADRPRQSIILVRLFPARHYVALACAATDASFDLFATGRRDRLFDLGELNLGSHAYVISTRRQATLVFVKAQSARPDVWVNVAELTPQGAGNKNGILEFYGLLDRLGRNEPNTVQEASYWGHGWHAGPVVRNTSDEAPDLLARDPNDFDGRPKDWHPQGTIATQFPRLKDAMHPQGRFLMGGCSHMVNVIRECRASNQEAKKGSARDDFYQAPMTGGHVNTTLDFTKRSLAQFVQSRVFNRYDIDGAAASLGSYIGLAAQNLNCDVVGAPPGAEANMGFIKGSKKANHQTMKVLAPIGGENINVVNFWKREFGDAFQPLDIGYASYTKLLNQALPDPGWSTLRHAFFTEWEWGKLLRLPSGLLVNYDDARGRMRLPVPHTEGLLTGHLYVLPRTLPRYMGSIPYLDGRVQKVLFVRRDTTHEMALFVTTVGQTLLRVRELPNGSFEVPTRAVPSVTLVLQPGERWETPANPVVTLLPVGEIEAVVPKWYW